MRKTILFTALVLAVMMSSAQNDTMYDRYERYYYTKWYDECPQYYDTAYTLFHLWPQVCNHIEIKEDYTPAPLKIKGLVAFVVKNPSNEHYIYDYRLPEYLYLYQKVGDSLRMVDSVRWDTAAPKTMFWHLNAFSNTTTECYAYEAYFTKPYTVDSVFAIGGSVYSNLFYYWEETDDYLDFIYRHTYYAGIEEQTCWGACRQNCRPYGTRWYYYPDFDEWYTWTAGDCLAYGLYQAIVDLYSLETASCDSTMGHVAGGGRFSEEASIRIEAVADSGYRFTQWSDGSTDNPRYVVLTQDTLLTACFELGVSSFLLTANSENSLKGTVSGGGIYDSNEVATLTATANSHYVFDRWNDGDTANPRNIVVVSDTAFTAYFVGESQESIAEAESARITLSPNPTSGKVKVSADEAIRGIKVFDMAGKEVLSVVSSGRNVEIDMAGQPSGTYVVRLETEKGTAARKLIVEK